MNKNFSELTERDFIVDALALQYIQGKTANSALEYVKLFRQAKAEIESAYKATEPPFHFESLYT